MSKLRVNEITDLNDNLLWNAAQGVGGAPVITSTGSETVADALDNRVNQGAVGSESVTTLSGTQTVNNALDARAIFLESNLSVGIPTDYTTMQEAVDDLSRYIPTPGTTITINIETGHALTAGVLFDDGEYSHFRITSDDATVLLDPTFVGISISSIAQHNDSVFVVRNSRGPTISCLVDMQEGNGAGVFVTKRGSIFVDSGAGVTNAGFFGCIVEGGSYVDAGSSIFSGAGTGNRITTNSMGIFTGADLSNARLVTATTAALDVSRGSVANLMSSAANPANLSGSADRGLAVRRSKVSANEINVSGAATFGVRAEDNSQVSCANLNAANCGNTAIQAFGASSVHAQGADLSGAGTRGIIADDCSVVNARDCDASGAGTEGVLAQHNSKINLRTANAQKGGSPVASDIVVSSGGIITAFGATGGLSVTANSISAAGIIFQ